MRKGMEAAERSSVLAEARRLKMARSAHAYVRGATADFYRWLDQSKRGQTAPEGPAVWICGDCHVGNLGPVAGPDDALDVEIRDLDQTVIGNPAHDLIRLGLSLATAARGADLPGVTTALMLEQVVAGYQLALRDPADADVEGVPEPGVVKAIRKRALQRRWRHLARERLATPGASILRGRRFWPLEPQERQAVDDLVRQPRVTRLVLTLEGRDAQTAVEMLDAAYWMKGCSSLGKLRVAALLRLMRKGEDDVFALVDLKEAVAPVAPVAAGAEMPVNPAERVVAGARALSPHLGERMATGDVLGRPVFVRELRPQDLKLALDQFTREEAVAAARYLAFVVGRAHGRQMDEATRSAWFRELASHRLGDLEAPTWLWTNVVDLAARHEQGYLEHCRRYALAGIESTGRSAPIPPPDSLAP